MIPKRLRLYMAGVVAFLLGLPFSAKAFGQSDTLGGALGDLVDTSTGSSAVVGGS